MDDINKQKLIKFKEKLIYELLISLRIDPLSFNYEDLKMPDREEADYNIYLVLKNNLEILKKIKEN